jgi:hypothetical protein
MSSIYIYIVNDQTKTQSHTFYPISVSFVSSFHIRDYHVDLSKNDISNVIDPFLNYTATETTQFVARYHRFHLCRLLDATQRVQSGPRFVQSISKARRSRDHVDHLCRLSRSWHVIRLRQSLALRLV